MLALNERADCVQKSDEDQNDRLDMDHLEQSSRHLRVISQLAPQACAESAKVLSDHVPQPGVDHVLEQKEEPEDDGRISGTGHQEANEWPVGVVHAHHAAGDLNGVEAVRVALSEIADMRDDGGEDEQVDE